MAETGTKICDVLPGGEALLTALMAEIRSPDVGRIVIAPGYLFVPGLAPLWEALEASTAREIHLMTGNTAGLLTVEQRFVAESESAENSLAPELDFAAGARTERDRVRDEVSHSLRENLIRMPKTPESENLLLSLARGIASNRVRARVYAEGRQHTKAAIVEKSSGVVAFVGTTNITLPVATNPTQINLRIAEPTAARQIERWLDSLWEDAQDFSRALFAEISASLTNDLTETG